MRRSRGAVAAVLVSSLAMAIVGCGDSVTSSTKDAQRATAAAEADLTAAGFTCRSLVVDANAASTTERCAWVADTPAEREQGLMGITDPSIGGRDAMVFVFDAPTTAAFWMKDTLLPLTVAWVAADGRILGTTDMAPCDPAEPRCPTFPPPGPYVMAIEVARGRAPELGLVMGATAVLGDPC